MTINFSDEYLAKRKIARKFTPLFKSILTNENQTVA